MKTKTAKPKVELATPEEIELARDQYAVGSSDDIEVDNNSAVSRDPETENIWVQAWVYVRKQ